jgi:TRAP-type C4-dicarboxylate transport system permease small subunit
MSEEGPLTIDGGGQPPVATEPDEGDERGLGAQVDPQILPRREPFRSLLRWLAVAEQSAGVVLLVTILVLVLAQIAQRYLPGGVAWTGEIARFAMVWLTFVMAGYLMSYDGHIAIKVVDYFVPARALAAVRLCGHALIALTCSAFLYAVYDFTTKDRGQVTPAAEIPLSAVYIVVAFGFASTALRAIVTIAVLDIRELRTGETVGS